MSNVLIAQAEAIDREIYYRGLVVGRLHRSSTRAFEVFNSDNKEIGRIRLETVGPRRLRPFLYCRHGPRRGFSLLENAIESLLIAEQKDSK